MLYYQYIHAKVHAIPLSCYGYKTKAEPISRGLQKSLKNILPRAAAAAAATTMLT